MIYRGYPEYRAAYPVEPIVALEVPVNHLVIASLSPDTRYLGIMGWGITVGKGLAIYQPELQNGLLAFLGPLEDPAKTVKGVIDSFGRNKLKDSTVTVISSMEPSTKSFPCSNEIAEMFELRGETSLPKKVQICPAPDDTCIRNVALDLSIGAILELDGIKHATIVPAPQIQRL